MPTASPCSIGSSPRPDVFVTNFPLPVRERLKIAASDLLPLNPRLIYASLSAYGEQGDEAGRTGFDSTAYWARTGLMDMVRATVDTEPARSVPGMGDHPSATALYAAIVTALYRREKTGKGGVAQSSLLQNGLWANACFVQSRLFGEHVPHRAPRASAPNPLANHYRCRDGRWFIMALFNEQRQLRGFLAAIGCTHLADDPRFATSAARKQNASALVAILDEVFAQRDLAEWRTILGAAGVTFGGVNSVDEASERCAVPTDRCARTLCRRQGPDGVQPVSSRRRDEGGTTTCSVGWATYGRGAAGSGLLDRRYRTAARPGSARLELWRGSDREDRLPIAEPDSLEAVRAGHGMTCQARGVP